MQKRLIRFAYVALLALGLCAWTAIGNLGFVGRASATVPNNDNSDKANLCRVFQEGYEQAVHLYLTSAPGSDAEKYAMKLIDVYIMRWNGAGCDFDYGNISARTGGAGDSLLNRSGGALESTSTGGSTLDHPAKAPITRGDSVRP